MESKTINGVALFYEAEEKAAAELIGAACAKTVQLIHRYWHLPTPADCRVYVMTSLTKPIFHAAPWNWKIMLVALYPLWFPKAKRTWPFTGGWAQRFGQRRMAGIKTPGSMQASDNSMGLEVFIPDENIEHKVRSVTCHELTHAFSDHLQLPAWLHEGLAMVTVDKFFGRPTVKPETLEILAQSAGEPPVSGRRIGVHDKDALIYTYVRGYWLTRYLEETKPELLKELLKERRPQEELETVLAVEFDLSYSEFWQTIDHSVVAHYQ